jgi:hypothetical protein
MVVSGWLREQLEEASPDLLRAMVKDFAEALMGAEAEALCGAGYGERSPEGVNRRNGYASATGATRSPVALGRFGRLAESLVNASEFGVRDFPTMMPPLPAKRSTSGSAVALQATRHSDVARPSSRTLPLSTSAASVRAAGAETTASRRKAAMTAAHRRGMASDATGRRLAGRVPVKD